MDNVKKSDVYNYFLDYYVFRHQTFFQENKNLKSVDIDKLWTSVETGKANR